MKNNDVPFWWYILLIISAAIFPLLPLILLIAWEYSAKGTQSTEEAVTNFIFLVLVVLMSFGMLWLFASCMD